MDIGKIYKIEGYGLTYYGSTTESLNRRLNRHIRHYKDFKDGKRLDKTTAFQIFDLGDEYKIVLVEHFLYNNKNEIFDKENVYISSNECINKNTPNITPEQKKQRQKEYNLNHKEQIKETAKIWAEKSRREKGQKIKAEMDISKQPDYSAKRMREHRAKMTPEEKEAYLEHRRLTRKPQTEEQKEKARERARKQRENKKLI
jgi:hypothetical protein